MAVIQDVKVAMLPFLFIADNASPHNIDGAGLGYHRKRSLAKEMLIVPGDK